MEVEHHTYLSSFHSASVPFLQSSRLTCCSGSRICFFNQAKCKPSPSNPPFSFYVPSSVYNYNRRKSGWNALQWSRKSSMNNDNSKRYKYLSWLLHPGSPLSKKHFSTQLWKSQNQKSNNTKNLKNPQRRPKCLSSTIVQ
jgi:hypothetical protein